MDDYAIFWSPLAGITYLDILEYLEYNWSEKVIADFIERTDEV